MSISDAPILREFIVEHFDLEELRTLCQDLEVDFDSLRGEGKEGKARELVAYMERHVRLDDLIVALKNERPSAWETLEYTHQPQAPMSEGTSYGERMRRQSKRLLQDPAWQGIGGVAAVLALVVAIGAWLWPNIRSTLLPTQPTPISRSTIAPSATVRPTSTLEQEATPTSQGLLAPSALMARALIGVVSPWNSTEFRSMGFAVSNTPYIVAGMTSGEIGETVKFQLATEPDSQVRSATIQASNADLFLDLLRPADELSTTGVPLTSSRELEAGVPVHLYSLRQGFVEGRVEEVDTVALVTSSNDQGESRNVNMTGVLKTSSTSAPGDIGSPVFDTRGRAVGIVVAGSTTTQISIAVTMEQLCRAFWNYLLEACQ